MRLLMTMSPASMRKRSSSRARSEPALMFCNESGVSLRVPQIPASSPESR